MSAQASAVTPTTARTKKPLDIERTRDRLAGLGLGHAADALERTLTDAVRDGTTPQSFLDALLGAESVSAHDPTSSIAAAPS